MANDWYFYLLYEAAIEKIKLINEVKKPHSLSKKTKSAGFPYPSVKKSSTKLHINITTCGSNKHNLITKRVCGEMQVKLLLFKFAQF